MSRACIGARRPGRSDPLASTAYRHCAQASSAPTGPMSDGLLKLGRRPPPPAGLVLWHSGFRPFFLAAPLVATVALAGWLAVLHGAVHARGSLVGVDLHVHEMAFGFVGAVIAGFLLTAVKNWTGRAPAPPRALAALAVLFVVGRASVIAEALGAPRGTSAVEPLFLVLLAVAVARVIVASRNWRNVGVAALVALLALADVLLHVAGMVGAPALAASMRAAALFLPCVLLAVVGGRVIPMFTRNVVLERGGVVRQPNALDLVAVGAVALAALSAALAPLGDAFALVQPWVMVAAGALTLVRMVGWASLHARVTPLVWFLHLGHACLGVGLVARGVAHVAPLAVPASAATHVVAVGGIAVLCLGMMTRVALGHTGRPLVLPRSAVAAYGALLTALALRVAAAWRPALLDPSAAAFALAFLLFLVGYLGPLVRPRVDGTPG